MAKKDTEKQEAKLWAAVRGGRTLSLRDASDLLDMSPKRAEALLADMRKRGCAIELDGSIVGARGARKTGVQRIASIPKHSHKLKIGVVSDLHFGSKYCLRRELIDTIEAMHRAGIVDIFVPGDLLDGCYSHSAFELSHVGFNDQAEDALETLPEKKGAKYHFIDGNHDATFLHRSGVHTGKSLVALANERGRKDLIYYGERSAYVDLAGCIIHMKHPGGSNAYALSYKPQKIIESYGPGAKPHILLIGHYHQAVHVFERGVHAFMCGTFQGGQSEFGQSLVGGPKIGGWIIDVDMAADGYPRHVSAGFRSYYEGSVLGRADAPEGEMIANVPTRGTWRAVLDELRLSRR